MGRDIRRHAAALAAAVIAWQATCGAAAGQEPSPGGLARAIPCASIDSNGIASLGNTLHRTGKAFGIPLNAWDDDLADAFKERIRSCGMPAGLESHFEFVWSRLGPDMARKRRKQERTEAEASGSAQRYVRTAMPVRGDVDAVTAPRRVAEIPCHAITRKDIAAFGRQIAEGEAFGIPVEFWSDEVAFALERHLASCFGDHAPDGEPYPLHRHFADVYRGLAYSLAEERAKREEEIRNAAAVRELLDRPISAIPTEEALAEDARTLTGLLKSKSVRPEEVDEVTARISELKSERRTRRDRRAKLEHEKYLARAAEAKAKREAEGGGPEPRRLSEEERIRQARAANPACVAADVIRDEIYARTQGGDSYVLFDELGMTQMEASAGEAGRACARLRRLEARVEEWRATSVDCSLGEAANINMILMSMENFKRDVGCWY